MKEQLYLIADKCIASIIIKIELINIKFKLWLN